MMSRPFPTPKTNQHRTIRITLGCIARIGERHERFFPADDHSGATTSMVQLLVLRTRWRSNVPKVGVSELLRIIFPLKEFVLSTRRESAPLLPRVFPYRRLTCS